MVILFDLKIELSYLLTFRSHKLTAGPESGLVVCMTTYPARVRYSWLALESLFRQTDKNFHPVLVLASGQFPSRKIPRMLRKLEQKGLEIIWVERDGRSFDHLWPAYVKYPSCAVISVDDDKFFDSDMVGTLRKEHLRRPDHIVGWRGWRMAPLNGEVLFSEGWSRATTGTKSKELFMPPGNGSLYPPGSLPEVTGDAELRNSLCPNADDVWYWAMARLAGTESYCLARSNHRAIWRQSRTDSLFRLNPGPEEFSKVLQYFRLHRRLLIELEDNL